MDCTRSPCIYPQKTKPHQPASPKGVGSVDLRTLDRHPGALIVSLIPPLSCKRYSPQAPFAKSEMNTLWPC
jgi:hypothetical protein